MPLRAWVSRDRTGATGKTRSWSGGGGREVGSTPIQGAGVGAQGTSQGHTEQAVYLAQAAVPSAHRKETRTSKAETVDVGEEEGAQERCNRIRSGAGMMVCPWQQRPSPQGVDLKESKVRF